MLPTLNQSLEETADVPVKIDHGQVCSPSFSTIEEALADMKVGRLVILFNDKSLKQSAYLVCAAQFVTPERVDFMTIQAKGSLPLAPLSLAMEQARLIALDLLRKRPDGISSNYNENKVRELPVGIGLNLPISGFLAQTTADWQARTVQACLNPQTKLEDLQQPGNISPVGAQAGGVLASEREIEAAVDLARLAGLYPAGLVCEVKVLGDDRRQKDVVLAYAFYHHLKAISITDLINYRLECETIVACEAVTKMPTEFGAFKVHAYRNLGDRSEHLAIIKGNPISARPVRVYLHAECLIGDAFGSLRCSCREQLSAAMQMIEKAEQGIIIYLRPADHGIGLVNQLKRYASQDIKSEILKTHHGQSLQSAPENFRLAAQILKDIGIHELLLITQSPCSNKSGLLSFGINVVDYIPLFAETNNDNIHSSPDIN